jgi:O-antigen ligase
LFVALLLLLAWAPIPIGSNREWSMALLVAGALGVSGGWLLSYAWRPFVIPGAVRSARASLLLLAAWAAFPLIQLMPLPVGFVQFAGGEVHGLYGQLPMEAANDYASFSIDRGATYSGFLRQCGLIALFASVLVLVTSTMRLRALMGLILLVGFIEALYGLAIFLAGDESALWSPGQAAGTVSGTYVNQNHFAGLMELAIPVGFGLLLSGRSAGEAASGTRDFTRLLSGYVLGIRGVVLFSVLIMAAALILTTSRGGTGSLAVGIAVAIGIAGSKRGLRTREMRVGMMAVALAFIAIFWLGSGKFSEKLEAEGFSSNRAEQRELSYEIIAANPLIGTGVGTYRWIFPTYKDERFGPYFYEHAHNDFLEILAEQGVIGFVLLAAGIGLIFIRVARAYVQRHDPLMRGALFATIAGCVSLLIHGLVDFNFQIPANAGYFFVLLGVGAVASDLRSRPDIRQTGLRHASSD